MDGVLVDTEPIYSEITKCLCKKLGFSITDQELNDFVGSKDLEKWKILRVKYSLEWLPEDLEKEESKLYIEHIKNFDISPINGSVQLIEQISRDGISIALASSSRFEIIDLILDKTSLKKYFKTIVSGYEVENGKPAPDIFLEASKRLGVLPCECLVIEDSSNGVKAAKAANMKCIGFLNHNSGNQDLSSADIIVEEISDVDLKKVKALFESNC